MEAMLGGNSIVSLLSRKKPLLSPEQEPALSLLPNSQSSRHHVRAPHHSPGTDHGGSPQKTQWRVCQPAGCSPLWLKSPHTTWGHAWKTFQRRSASKGDRIQQPQRSDQPWKTVSPWKTVLANSTGPPAHPEQLSGTLLRMLKGSHFLATLLPPYSSHTAVSSVVTNADMCTQADIHTGKTCAHTDTVCTQTYACTHTKTCMQS